MQFKWDPLQNDERDYDAILFSFLKDAKFIDFAFDECGINFVSDMFKIDTKDDDKASVNRNTTILGILLNFHCRGTTSATDL